MHYKTDRRLKGIYNRFSHSEKSIHRAYMESIHALINLTEARDHYTKGHSLKVSGYAALLAKRIGMSKKDIDNIKLAAILHDVGKIGIREKVLSKNGSLTKKEFEEVKKHAEIGVEIIKPLKFFSEVILMIKYHHENYDGTGYPDALEGKEIPLGAQILAIADVYDALTSRRAYRRAYSHKETLKIMKKESENGKKFNPVLIKVFIACLDSKRKRSK